MRTSPNSAVECMEITPDEPQELMGSSQGILFIRALIRPIAKATDQQQAVMRMAESNSTMNENLLKSTKDMRSAKTQFNSVDEVADEINAPFIRYQDWSVRSVIFA